jgi:hypothetical protein
MLKIFSKYKESKFHFFIVKHKKYAPLFFFIAGFTWDSLTLGRIDRLYDNVVLCTYMTALTLSIYFYNLVDSEKWKNTFIQKYGAYLPLAIQFFLGGLSSAYVIYFSRSVSLSKTASFFFLLILLFIANEFLRKRISNKYLQFAFYFFVNFIFFTFFIPVLLKEMNSNIFLISGAISLFTTLFLIILVYRTSVLARTEIVKRKMFSLISCIYILLNASYFFKIIPPVPLALDKGLVAYDIQKEENFYKVTYEIDEWFYFWRDHKIDFYKKPDDPVYVFTSVFAPTDLKKNIYHSWKWFDKNIDDWVVIEDIGFQIIGGRDTGFRGYTYKNNIWEGDWKVEVVTEEGLVLGIVDFIINTNTKQKKTRLVEKLF